MKYLKLSCFILLIAILINTLSVNAGVIYKKINVYEILNKQEISYTNYYEKEDWSNPTYEHLDMFTDLTMPCNNCKIIINMRNQNGDASYGIMPTIGSKHIFTGGAVSQPGIYRLSMYRYDWTLLKTTMSGHWYLNDKGVEIEG